MYRITRTRAPLGALRQIRNARFASTESTSSSFSPALIGGLTGGLITFAGGYAYYHFSGAKTLVNTAHQTKQYYEDSIKGFQNSSVSPSDALSTLKQTATQYAAFIPGASGIVDTAFNDLESVRNKHSDEVDKLVKQTYDDLRSLTSEGLNVQTATKAWSVIQKFASEVADLAKDSASDILKNHPELKKKFGDNLSQLESLGDKYGPEAKKQVEQTWNQISDVIKGGINTGTVDKIRKIVEEKMQLVQKIRDEAWDEGMKQAKGAMDKNPKLKEMIEKNADTLKKGNFTELYSMLKEAAQSGDTSKIEKHVNEAVEKVKEAGGSK